MKTSKILLLTFVGLLFCITTVVVDLNNRGQMASLQELPTAVKSYVKKYYPNMKVACANMKESIKNTAYEMAKNGSYEQGYCGNDLLAYYEY